jgi:chemotaxis protein CheX
MLDCRPGIASSQPDGDLGVTAMVGLAGQLCGVLNIHCNSHAAALMASKMLHVPFDQVGEGMSDALGEICNMVAGNFKNKVPGLGDGCMLSPPTVITGSDYDLHSLGASPSRWFCCLKTCP